MIESNTETANYITDLLLSACSTGHSSVTKAIEQFTNTAPDADKYLLSILLNSIPLPSKITSSPGLADGVRVMAGIVLKNHLKAQLSSNKTQPSLDIKDHLIEGLVHNHSSLIQSTIGNILAVMSQGMGYSLWPTLLPQLINISTPAALSAISKILADSAYDLCREMPNEQLALILDGLICAMPSHPCLAIECMNELILQDGLPFETRIGTLVQALSLASQSRDWKVRKVVCISLGYLMEGHPDEMQPYVNAILQHQLHALQVNQPEDREVALEAADFWQSLAEREEHCNGVSSSELLVPLIASLLPLLLRNMIYTEDDPEWDNTDDDPKLADENVRTMHHTPSQHGSVQEEEEEEEDQSFAWTLRKASASALDSIANIVPPSSLVSALLPLISNMLSNQQQWLHLEAGILALGAVAPGCYEAISEHLGQLIPFLLSLISHQQPLVRSIAAWTLGRYCSWFEEEKEGSQDILKHAVNTLTNALMDTKSKRAQRAAATALRQVFEHAGGNVDQQSLDSLITLCSQLMNSPLHAHTKTLHAVYGMLEIVAETCADHLEKCTDLSNLLTILVQKWFQEDNNSTGGVSQAISFNHLFPLLECLCSLSVGVGVMFARSGLAGPMLNKAFDTARLGLLRANTLTSDPESSEDDIEDALDYAIIAVDLIGGLVQGLKVQLDNATSDKLTELIKTCCLHDHEDVRQSGFALLGDAAQNKALGDITLLLDQVLLPAIHANLVISDTANSSVANNAAWALGELASKGYIKTINQTVSRSIPALCQILLHAHNSQRQSNKENDEEEEEENDYTYLGNVAVCLARLLSLDPRSTSSSLNQPLLNAWQSAMLQVGDVTERQEAMQGMQSVLDASKL